MIHSLRTTVSLLALASVFAPTAAFSHAQATTTVQFDREIVRILETRCVMCHAEPGPSFPLVTYEQAYAARWQIRQSALERHMPVWPAVAGYGDFENDNGLTQREIDFLVSWAESYGPRNNGAVYSGVALQTPSTPVQAQTHFEHWRIGEPDEVLTVPSAKTQRVIIDPKLKSDRWLRALEFRPGDPRSVRAVSFSLQATGQWIGSWTPWHGFMSLPEGLAIRLPAGSRIVAEFQSSAPSGKAPQAGTEPSLLGLHYTDSPSTHVVSSFVVEAKPSAGKLVASHKANTDMHLLALRPVLPPGLSSIEVSARRPDGTTEILLFARRIQAEWPTPYIYRRPVVLPAGTELRVVEHYAREATLPATGSVLFSVSQR